MIASRSVHCPSSAMVSAVELTVIVAASKEVVHTRNKVLMRIAMRRAKDREKRVLRSDTVRGPI
jgi:hypothetical protein